MGLLANFSQSFPRRLVALIPILALLAGPAGAAAESGVITGGTANATWTMGHVDNLKVTMDLCGSDGQPTCKWNGVAGVMPAANGDCPEDWFYPGTTDFKPFWASPNQTVNGTVQSGPRNFNLDGAAGQRVCVYLERTFTATGFSTSFVLVSKLLKQPPETQITKAQISSATRTARFAFKSAGTASGFQCSLTKPGRSPVFGGCTSPKAYSRLGNTTYVFQVRATGPNGVDPTPAKKQFTISG
jgi:hypothetical protein